VEVADARLAERALERGPGEVRMPARPGMATNVGDRLDAVSRELLEEFVEGAVGMAYGQKMHPGSTSRSHGWLRHRRLVVAGAVVAFAAIVYAPMLDVPFIGDDYVFLDKTRAASFAALWSLHNTDFGWYRPWSRELHFWTLQHLLGPHETGFRVVSLLIWLGMLAAYYALLRRIRDDRVAAVATLGVVGLALWGAPLTWISGVQDLWMLLFAMLTLWLVATGRTAWALATCAGALLSKETAAMLPLIVLAQAHWVERRDLRGCLRRGAPFVALTVGWLALHPTLLHRVSRPEPPIPNGERRHPPAVVIGESLLSTFNADRLLLPLDPELQRRLVTVVVSLLLAGAASVVLRGAARPDAGPSRRAMLCYGGAWCVAGWLPLLSRSIGWHAYYGSLGVLGAWVALAELLAAWPGAAVASLLVLGLLRGRAEATRSWDWGSQWYQVRAGRLLRVIHDQVLQLHPSLPPHSRLYFGSIPNNIGLIAGRSPALRVWYDDPTLEAGFYSHYHPRAAGEPFGPDLFFHFDSTAGIREVTSDGADGGASSVPETTWAEDHVSLAMTFLSGGDLPRAARLFESVGRIPNRPEALMFAAACWEAAGDSAAAARDRERARGRTGFTPEEISSWAARLRATMPRHPPTEP